MSSTEASRFYLRRVDTRYFRVPINKKISGFSSPRAETRSALCKSIKSLVSSLFTYFLSSSVKRDVLVRDGFEGKLFFFLLKQRREGRPENQTRRYSALSLHQRAFFTACVTRMRLISLAYPQRRSGGDGDELVHRTRA